jgi:hypothetical protein
LGLDQDQVNKQDDKIVLDIFVGESLAVGALCETDSFPESSIVGFTVHGVQLLDGSAACDAYRHACLDVTLFHPTMRCEERDDEHDEERLWKWIGVKRPLVEMLSQSAKDCSIVTMEEALPVAP